MTEPPMPSGAPSPPADVYTMAEAARLKGVSYHTVSRAVRRGTLPSRRVGRMAFITADDLRAWRPMLERAPRKYQRRRPDPSAAPAVIDLASGDRTQLALRLALLYEAINAAAELPLPDSLHLLSQRLVDALGFRRVAVWGVDEGRGAAVRLVTVGPPMSDLPDELPLAEVPAFARYLREGEAIVADAATFGPVPAPLRDVSALFAAPLRVGGQVRGALFGDCAGEPFELNPEQIALARGVAAHAALALELARLRDKAQG